MSANAKTKKKMPVFWKAFIVIMVLLLIGSAIIWVTLWNYLKVYESTRPTVAMDALVEDVNKGDYSELIKYSPASEMEPDIQRDFSDKLREIIAGRTVIYEKAFSPDKDTHPVFTLRADKDKIAKVTMELDGRKKDFDLEGYKISEVSEIPIMSETVTITAPAGYQVFVDGRLVSDKDKYVAETGIAVEELKSLPEGYFTKPTLVKYVVDDLVKVPEITVTAPNGLSPVLHLSEDGRECEAEFAGTADPTPYYEVALKKAKTYSQYVTAWVGLGTMLDNMLPDSPMRDGIASIQTGFYTDHKKDYFSDEVTEHLQIYDENCYSCDISYIQWIEDIRTNHDFKKDLPSAFTFYFVKTNDDWKIADLIIR